MKLSFLKLDINILNDEKIKIIRKYPDGDSLIVLWLGLLCLAMRSENAGYVYISEGIPYTDSDLANIFDMELKTIEMGLELFQKFKMVDFMEGGIIEIINFSKHQELDKIEHTKRLNRDKQKKYRERKKQVLIPSNGNVTVTLPENNPTDIDIDKDLDKDIDKKKDAIKKKKYIDHVLLYEKEIEKLFNDYGNKTIDVYMDRLNNYIGSTGKRYKSHYHTILSWMNKDNIKKISSKPKTWQEEAEEALK